MYEINWHWIREDQKMFSHCTIAPVTVLSTDGRGIIRVEDQGGIIWRGLVADFHMTESEAYAAARHEIEEAMNEEISRHNKSLEAMRAWLEANP